MTGYPSVLDIFDTSPMALLTSPPLGGLFATHQMRSAVNMTASLFLPGGLCRGRLLMGDAAAQAGVGDEGDCAEMVDLAGPVVRVRTDRLDGSYSPRRDGEDQEHVRLLAES